MSQLYKHHLSLALALSVSLVACGDDDTGPDQLSSIMTADDGQVGVELLTESGGLIVGRNVVYYKVTMTADDTPVTTATVTQAPLMQMMDFSHACPETDPTAANSDGLYQGKLVFTMPSGSEGTWSDTVTVVLDGETTEHEIKLDDLTVAANDRRKTLQWTEGESDITGFITLNPDAPWAVGQNSYIMTAHYRQDMMHFPELADTSVVVSVAKGDAAPAAATAPTYDKDGEHLGSIELPEAGTYTVTATLTKASVELGSVSWTVELQ